MSKEEQVRIVAAMKKHLPKDLQVDDLKITMVDDQPVFHYNILDKNGRLMEKVEKPYTLDNVGSYIDPDVGLGSNILRGLTSPKYVQGLDAKGLVDQAMVGTFAQAKMGANYTSAAEAAFKPIKRNKKSIQKVDDMLQLLDGRKIDPTYQQLVVEGVGGKRLTPKEFQAFTGVRKVLDDMHYRNNKVMRQEMDLRGTRLIKEGDEKIFAKPYDDADSANAAYHGDEAMGTIYKDGQAFDDVSHATLQQAYKDGYVLVRSHADSFDDWFKLGEKGDSNYFRFALVKKDAVRDLPPDVLNKTPNYLPKFNKDANFFIKEVRNVIVNGKSVPKPITLAYAATKAEALKWKKQQEALDVELGTKRTLVQTEQNMDKTLDTGDVIRASGGLIRGKRSKDGIEYAGNFGGGRADAFEALQRAIAMTADRVTMSRWRMSAMQEWRNSAALHLKKLPEEWKPAREAIADMEVGPVRTKLLSAHDQISGMSHMPTKGEQAFKGHILTAARKLDGINLPFLGKTIEKGSKALTQRTAAYLYRVRDNSPVNLLKSVTFNMTLGAFSMVQIPVQTAGALVAIAANPIHAGKAMDTWLIASALDLGTDMKVVGKTGNILGKRMGLDKNKLNALQNDYEFWRASGMREAVVRGNADASSVMNGLPLDANLMRRGFGHLLQAGQTPYRMGELANMRISFFTALEREKALVGKGFKYDDATLQRVLSRTESTRLNMNAANKAMFQKGFLSLPTQFKQIYTKYLEAVAGREFTRTEKFRIFSSQTMAFGAAGVPILNHYADSIMEMAGVTKNSDSTEQQMWLRGTVGVMLNDYYGIDAVFSGRMTVSADIIEDIKKMFTDGRTPVFETFAGASSSPLKHGLGFMENIFMAGNMVYQIEDYNPAQLGYIAEIVLEGLARMSSSGRSAIAARDLLYDGVVRNSDGVEIYKTDPDLADILFRAIGFGSQETHDLYAQSKSNMSIEEERRGRVDQYVSAFHTLINNMKQENKEMVHLSHVALSMIKIQIERYPDDERDRIWASFLDKVNSPRDMKGDVINKALKTWYEDSANAFNTLNPTVTKAREEKEARGQAILDMENE